METTSKTSATIAIVSSHAFDYGPADLDAETDTPAGNDLATLIMEQLVKVGGKCLGEPVPGEEGWTFDVGINGKQFRVFVHWSPIGDHSANRWVLQSNIQKSLLRSLFWPRATNLQVQPVVHMLRAVLVSSAEIDDVNWVSEEEFASTY